MSKTKKKDYLDTNNIPRSRRDFQDYDYISELDDEAKVWLEQFTKEYYGAGFEINNTYITKEDAISSLQYLIGCEKKENKKNNYKKHLDTLMVSNEAMVQVSNNDDKRFNIDLRKLRKVDKYYKQANGKFTKNEKFKYSNDNIHSNKELRTKCNKTAEAQQKDLYAQFFNSEKYYVAEKILEYNNEDITTLDPETLVEFFEDYKD